MHAYIKLSAMEDGACADIIDTAMLYRDCPLYIFFKNKISVSKR